MVFAAITAHAQSDSIPPSLPPTYPYLTPISTVEELNADVMSLKFSKADANAKKLITAAKRKKQSTAEYDKVWLVAEREKTDCEGWTESSSWTVSWWTRRIFSKPTLSLPTWVL